MDIRRSLLRAGIKAGTATHVAIYRLTEGRVGAEMNGDVILLTTKGRTSGQLRTTPVMRVEHEGAIHVVGSAGGADHDPAWFRNLSADPRVRVRDRDRVWDARAVVLEGDERDVAYAAAVAHMDGFGDYEQRTDRTIPVARLESLDPREATGAA